MDNNPQRPFTGDPPSSHPTLPTTSPTIQGTHHTTTPSSEPLGPTIIPAASQQGLSTASLPVVQTHDHSGARNLYAQDDHLRSSSSGSFSSTSKNHSAGTISNCHVRPAPHVSHFDPRNASNHNDQYSPSLRYYDAQPTSNQCNHFSTQRPSTTATIK